LENNCIDINIDNLCKAAKNHKHVKFVKGSTLEFKKFVAEHINELPKPWFIIEDAHFGTEILLQDLNEYLTEGGYVIVEDTNIKYNEACKKCFPETEIEMKDEYEACAKNLLIVENFLKLYDGKYLIDSYYQDFFGYNVLKSWNCLFRCMK